ncbi:MAG: hypothetical protein NVSMB1_03330 [Polyangiales bacterium]
MTSRPDDADPPKSGAWKAVDLGAGFDGYGWECSGCGGIAGTPLKECPECGVAMTEPPSDASSNPSDGEPAT